MKISTTQTAATITRNFVITEDAPVVAMAYSQPPKQFRVTKGVIEYTRQDGGWKVESGWAIKLTGPVLKKDGTDSKNVHGRNPGDDYDWRVHDSGREWVAPEGWEWLDAIVGALRPSGAITLPEFDAAEVTE